MLKVYFNTIDSTLKMSNFVTDGIAFSTFTTDKFIKIGFKKPLKVFHVELLNENTVENKLIFKYSNGSIEKVLSVFDYTEGFKKSGAIEWVQPDDEKESVYLGQRMYWYTLSLEQDYILPLTFIGFGMVFSSDSDLLEDRPTIMSHLGELKSFIGFHQSSRNDIVQQFNSNLNFKYNGEFSRIEPFDLLEISEVKDAAKYLTLQKIFDWLSDNVDDKYSQLASQYETKFGRSFNSAFITIDKNDNGKADNNEKITVDYTRIVRLWALF